MATATATTGSWLLFTVMCSLIAVVLVMICSLDIRVTSTNIYVGIDVVPECFMIVVICVLLILVMSWFIFWLCKSFLGFLCKMITHPTIAGHHNNGYHGHTSNGNPDNNQTNNQVVASSDSNHNGQGTTHQSTSISSRVTTSLTSRITTGIASRVTTGITSSVTTGRTSGVTTSIASNVDSYSLDVQKGVLMFR